MKQLYEVRELAIALQSYLATKDWTDLNIKEGWGNESEEDIKLRDVSVYIVTTRKVQLELGEISKTYKRPIQIDAYMETEAQADAIVDDIIDFMDIVPIAIKDENNVALGEMSCETESIISTKLTPLYSNPKVTWWRGVVRGTYEVNYYN